MSESMAIEHRMCLEYFIELLSFLSFTKVLTSPYRVISHHQNIKLTYDELHQDSDRLARGLMSLGVEKGDRCCVSLGNNIEFATVGLWFLS